MSEAITGAKCPDAGHSRAEQYEYQCGERYEEMVSLVCVRD